MLLYILYFLRAKEVLYLIKTRHVPSLEITAHVFIRNT